jgi:hypothetical protein
MAGTVQLDMARKQLQVLTILTLPISLIPLLILIATGRALLEELALELEAVYWALELVWDTTPPPQLVLITAMLRTDLIPPLTPTVMAHTTLAGIVRAMATLELELELVSEAVSGTIPLLELDLDTTLLLHLVLTTAKLPTS